jgi:UDP-N-acetylmuramoyl-L-alanyl-D-glutamate--2,6-diaminopimelate ligase
MIMKRLSDLIDSMMPLEVNGATDVVVSGIYYDSRKVEPNGLFFALKGSAVDGHQFIPAALEKGASVIVMEEEVSLPASVTGVLVKDGRLAMARVAAAFYDFPTDRVPVVGITGTNGKTTTTFLMERIMIEAGAPPAVLGTISYRFGAEEIPAPNTTPESVDLQGILRTFVDRGAKGTVMEVSSHALDQRRVDGCRFDVGIFSNLTRDHLDYHKDMASYFQSKLRFFSELLAPDQVKPCKCGAVNIDDPYGAEIIRQAACEIVTYGLSSAAQVRAEEVIFSGAGITAKANLR